MSEDSSKTLIREPVFDHKSSDTRSEKFSKFLSLLTTYLGSLHATVGAMAVSVVVTGTFQLDADADGDWYNLKDFYAAHHLDINDASDRQKWAKIQWTLLHVLQKSFSASDPAIIQSNDYTAVRNWHCSEWGVNPTDPLDLSCDWLPFGTILLARLHVTYVDQTGTDALVKILNHEQAKIKFHSITNLNSFLKWKQTLLTRWKEVESIVSKYDASYLAGLQLLEVVKRHPAKRLSQTAHMFTEKHQNNAFTIEQLLETLHNTFNNAHLEHQGNSLYPVTPHVHSTMTADAPGGGGEKVQKSGKKPCRFFDTCKGYTPAPKLRLCNKCHISQRAGISMKAAGNLINKQASKLRKKFAKRSKPQGKKPEVHELQAEETDESSAAQVPQLNTAAKKAARIAPASVNSLMAQSVSSSSPNVRPALGANAVASDPEIFSLDELRTFGKASSLKQKASAAVSKALKANKMAEEDDSDE